MKSIAGLLLFAACGSAGSALPDAFVATISSLEVTPSTLTIKRGLDASTQLDAKAVLSTSTKVDVTSSATWTSSDPTLATVSDEGVVTPVAPGTVTITADYHGSGSSSASITIVNAQMYLTDAGAKSVTIFDAYGSGAPAPARQIVGATTTFSTIWGIKAYHDEIYVTDIGANAIDVFAANVNGDVAPVRRIIGATTTLASPFGIDVVDDEIYVTSGGKILVFPISATGDVAPTRTITGTTTTLPTSVTGLSIYNDEVYVSGFSGIWVFPQTATGDIAPNRTITGPHTQISSAYTIVVRNDEIIVANLAGLRVFLASATGDANPIRSIVSSPETTLQLAPGVAALGNEIFSAVAAGGQPSVPGVSVFPSSATSDVVPTRSTRGVGTLINDPRNITFY